MMKNKKSLVTLNSWGNMHWAVKSKIKVEYKELLKTWFLTDEKLPEKLHFDWQPIYKDNRKRDSINVSPSIKVIEDCLTELGCIIDDDQTSHLIRARKVDKTFSDHTIELKLYERIND